MELHVAVACVDVCNFLKYIKDSFLCWTRDPIQRIREVILANSLASSAEIKELEKAIRAEVNEAVEHAKVRIVVRQHSLN